MKLYHFLKVFEPNTPIAILDENENILDKNIVGEVTQKVMNRRRVLSATLEKNKLVVATFLDKEC